MSERKPYHHGDLRSTLVATGLQQLESGGEATLSLRALAKAAGVSPNAPYRHFTDKNDLMGALAAEGFSLFASAVVAAEAGPGVEALRNQGRAYLEFATTHPALYGLMFSPYGYTLHSDPCRNEATRAFGSLVATAARAQAEGWKSSTDLAAAVLGYWSALHGWAGLVGDNLVPPEVPRPTIEVWLDVFFDTFPENR